MILRGREPQCVAVDGLLAEVRAARSRILVVRGEPGIGKTALLASCTVCCLRCPSVHDGRNDPVVPLEYQVVEVG